MPDEKATAEVEEQKTKKESGGFGVGKAILLSAGALLVFVLGIPLCLLLNGMLSASSPYLVPIEGNAMVDSMIAEVVAIRGNAVEAGVADAERQQVETDVSEAVDRTVDDEVADSEISLESVEPTDEAMRAETDKTDETAGSDEWKDIETVGPPVPGSGLEEIVARAERNAGESQDEYTMDPERLKRLVKVYEKMRPKQVALILNTMPERQAAGILSGMKGAVAGKVFAEMEPNKAARMSQLLLKVNDNER